MAGCKFAIRKKNSCYPQMILWSCRSIEQSNSHPFATILRLMRYSIRDSSIRPKPPLTLGRNVEQEARSKTTRWSSRGSQGKCSSCLQSSRAFQPLSRGQHTHLFFPLFFSSSLVLASISLANFSLSNLWLGVCHLFTLAISPFAFCPLYSHSIGLGH